MPTTQARPARAASAGRGFARAAAPSSSIASAGARGRAGRRADRAPTSSPRRRTSTVARRRQTMTSGWPKPRSRRRRVQISSFVRPARAPSTTAPKTLPSLALGGAGRGRRAPARPRPPSAPPWRPRSRRGGAASPPRSGRSTGGRSAASSSAWYLLTPTTTCSPASTRLLEAHRRGADHALHEARPRPPCTCRRRRRSSS